MSPVVGYGLRVRAAVMVPAGPGDSSPAGKAVTRSITPGSASAIASHNALTTAAAAVAQVSVCKTVRRIA